MKTCLLFSVRILLIKVILALLISLPSNGQIILSEVMFDPIGNEYYNEFIEIYNISTTDTIDLATWQISDSSDVDFIIPYDQGTLLMPRLYALILDPGYFENSQQYENLIPPEALILTIDDGSFGSQGLSNSYPEPIILISSSGDTAAKYRYTLNNQPGFSDEKRNLFGDDSPENWANSQVLNGTPGFENSVRQYDHDIKLDLLGFPPEAVAAQSITLIASIINIGLISASNIEILFFEDLNSDSLLSVEEQIGQPFLIADSLKPGENLQARTVIDSLPGGPHFFCAKAYFPLDQDTLNNLASTVVKIGFQPNGIIINEIMYRPSAELAEWFELYNPGNVPANLQYWQFSDAHTDKRIDLSDAELFIPGKGYLIIAEDSTIYQSFSSIPCDVYTPAQGFPPLNNDGDQIVLYDLIGTIIDQVRYETSWGSATDVSLERKLWSKESNDPSNWGLSQYFNGGTPGMKNSISPKNHDLSLRISIQHIYSDSIIVLAIISNVGLLPAPQFQCDFYIDSNLDSSGQESEFAYSFVYARAPLLSADSITIRQNIPVYRQGLNQLIAQINYEIDENQFNNHVVIKFIIPFNPGQLIINEIMFRPLSGDPEWIEIFNPDIDSINLVNWKFSDANLQQKHIIVAENFWIAPKRYILIAQSEDIYAQLHDSLFTHVIIPRSLPTLNNNSDQVVLYDLTDKTIDSMAYLSHWNPGAGVSLERIDYTISSTDSSNWAASIDTTGSTPGRFNSVSPLNFDLALTGIDFVPLNPFPDEEILISVWVANVGRFSMSEFQLACFIDINQDNVFQDIEKIGETVTISQILHRGESLSVSIPYTPSHSGCFHFNAILSSALDLKSSNNSYSTILSIGFEKHSLVINEVMYSPATEQSEWFELYNPRHISVDIQNWSFSDADTSEKRILTNKYFSIAPNTFFIIAADSSVLDFFDLNNSPLLTISKWPELNNDEDDIVIFDANENIIDGLHYTNKWGGTRGISLERINPGLASDNSSNWSSCVHIHGGTPGRKNSIFVEVLPPDAELCISPNPFSPDGDCRDDVTIINYQLPFNLSQIHVKIFDIRGRQVRFLVNNRSAGTNGAIVWDGRDDQGQICRMGIYIVYLEAIHYQRGVVKSLKKSVVLAKQL
jgi:hypothetical protein